MSMAISRRLRFEILRRDGHTCRYCGAMAPDVQLTVDHVTPVALGGSDDPSNLVAACADCNGGKSSIAPGSPLVADVAADAIRWARALDQARLEFEAERDVMDTLLHEVWELWHNWTYPVEVTDYPEPLPPTGDPLVDNWHELMSFVGRYAAPVSFVDGVLTVCVERGHAADVRQRVTWYRKEWEKALGAKITKVACEQGEPYPPPLPPKPTKRTERRHLPLPKNWADSVKRFLSLGLTVDDLDRLIRVAMENNKVAKDETFRYFCGCAWRQVTDLQESARRILESEGE